MRGRLSQTGLTTQAHHLGHRERMFVDHWSRMSAQLPSFFGAVGPSQDEPQVLRSILKLFAPPATSLSTATPGDALVGGRWPIACCLAVLSSASGLAGCKATVASAAVPVRSASITPVDAEAICQSDTFSIAPDGSRAVFWPSGLTATGLSRMQTVDLDCVAQAGSWKACPAISMEEVNSKPATIPIGWAKTGQTFYAASNGTELVEISFGPGRPTPTRRILAADIHRAYGPVLRFLDNPSSLDDDAIAAKIRSTVSLLSRLSPNTFTPWSVGIDPSAGWGLALYERTPDLALVAQTNDGRHWPSSVVSRWLLDPEIMRLPGSRIGVVATGYLATLDRGWHAIPVEPWSRPMVDASANVLAGVHTPYGLSPDARRAYPGLAGEIDRELSGLSARLLMRVQIAGQRSVFLSQDIWGVRRYSLSVASKPPVTLACSEPPSIPSAMMARLGFGPISTPVEELVTPPVNVRPVDVGSSDRPLPAELFEVAHPKGFVVFFAGGPSSIKSYHEYAPRISRLIRLGYSVLSVSYSGSTGAGPDLASRLGSSPATSIMMDTKDLAAWLNKQGIRRVAVVGESFGAAPAISLEQRSAAVGCTVLFVPFLKHRPPKEWTWQAERGGFAPDYQERVERAVYGAEPVFGRWLSDMVASWKPKGPVYAAFGSLDPVSKEADLRPRPQVTSETFEGSHSVVPALDTAWSRAAEVLGRCL